MKIVFIGTVEFSFRALEKLLSLKSDIAGVVTKKKSAFNSDFADLTPLCAPYGLPVFYADNINSPECLNWIKEKKPDLIFCSGFSQIIGAELLSTAPMGVIGYHPSLLPLNRGRHPLIWALALGLEETGSTFFFMDAGADSGDILSQKKIAIDYEDDASALYRKMTETALKQIEEFMPELEKGTYRRIPQDHKIATYWRKRGVDDGKIDFRMSSKTVYNLVRALAKPYCGAHLLSGGNEIKVWKAKEVEDGNVNCEPGKVLKAENNEITVKCGENAVCLVEHEFQKIPAQGDYIL